MSTHGKSYLADKLHARVHKRYKLMRKMALTHATVVDLLLAGRNSTRGIDRRYSTAKREANCSKPTGA